MPNNLGPTASRFSFGTIGFLKIASTDSASRARGELRSAGVSFRPSGIHTFVTQVLPRALPIAAPISRLLMQFSIQNLRIPLSACDSVKPSAAFGGEKQVGLKSRPSPFFFAQAIQF